MSKAKRRNYGLVNPPGKVKPPAGATSPYDRKSKPKIVTTKTGK